jgi:hypothetical protein
MGTLVLALLAVSPWTKIQDGVEYRTYPMPAGVLQVARVNPKVAQFKFGLATQDKTANKTPNDWRQHQKMCLAINAGMYATNYATNVGALKSGDAFNNAKWSSEYQSVFVFGAKDQSVPTAQILDRDDPGFENTLKHYGSYVQNLRLVKGDKKNVWKPNGRAWSEAALAQDAQGNLLFLFSVEPMEMAAWNDAVLQLDLGVIKAMHLDGGPPAGFSIKGPNFTLNFAGVSEFPLEKLERLTRQSTQLPIPNVLGVLSR